MLCPVMKGIVRCRDHVLSLHCLCAVVPHRKCATAGRVCVCVWAMWLWVLCVCTGSSLCLLFGWDLLPTGSRWACVPASAMLLKFLSYMSSINLSSGTGRLHCVLPVAVCVCVCVCVASVLSLWMGASVCVCLCWC
eukprot:GHVQ01019609.1.p1 GENE.GHVQ01019609.1~~GHVQ01019609.1.p1  ORF type:complete len:136 (-),score=22.65 GHVQ01019609.1:915-1322(-)